MSAVLMGSCGGETKNDGSTENTTARLEANASPCFIEWDPSDTLADKMWKRKLARRKADSLKSHGLVVDLDTKNLLSVIPCNEAKDLVNYYKKYVDIDPDNPLTKFVDFPFEDFDSIASEYRGKAKFIRVYFGANPDFVNNRRVSVTTVMFRGANPLSTGGNEDVPCVNLLRGTQAYDLGIPCPPPRCPGRSDYYTPTEMEEIPK